MGKIRHVFPGGNTSEGFYSLYDYMVNPGVRRKLCLKGGPGVGKSSFMKKIGQHFAGLGVDIEYHWCSSDNDSLDGVVIGDHAICLVDGTAPHIIDPRYPGAIDEVINLGQYWHRDMISRHRQEIISLSSTIARCFERAYLRLQEARLAISEWASYIIEARDGMAVNRNILALAEDFLRGSNPSSDPCRHLFAAAITPQGVVTHIESLVENNYSFYGVKGSPGSGVKELLDHTARLIGLNHTSAEVYHNPLLPDQIDLIVLPAQKTIMLDLSSHIVDYEQNLPNIKFKRWLDFSQFMDSVVLAPYQESIDSAQNRLKQNLAAAVAKISQAKKIHDQLETHYIPAMDFTAIDAFREELQQELVRYLS